MKKRISVLILLIAIFFSACSPFGSKVEINEKSEVYYKEGAKEEEAKKLGDFLLRNNYFDTRNERSVQLTHSSDNYVVKFVVNKDRLKGDQQAEMAFRLYQLWIKDSVFNGAPTKIILADKDFKEIKTVQEITPEEINGGTGNGARDTVSR